MTPNLRRKIRPLVLTIVEKIVVAAVVEAETTITARIKAALASVGVTDRDVKPENMPARARRPSKAKRPRRIAQERADKRPAPIAAEAPKAAETRNGERVALGTRPCGCVARGRHKADCSEGGKGRATTPVITRDQVAAAPSARIATADARPKLTPAQQSVLDRARRAVHGGTF